MMRTVRIHADEDVRIDDIDEPGILPGKVLLRGGYTGICGSDLHLFFESRMFGWDFTQPAPLTGATWPQILGHEFSGVVTETDPERSGLAVGDRVAVFPYHSCGVCEACVLGAEWLCPLIAFEGIQGQSGGMAELKVVDADSCFVLPGNVDLKLGALVEPMAVAWHGVAASHPEAAGGALVVGGGPVGLGAYFALKAQGVQTVLVSEPSAQRREILRAVGVEHVIDPLSESLAERCRAVLPTGVAVVLDCAGVPAAVPDALNALSVGGRMVILAAYSKPIELLPRHLRGDKSIRTSTAYSRADFAAVIDAMASGVYQMQAGWVEVVEFDGVVSALRGLRAGDGMKVLVRTPE